MKNVVATAAFLVSFVLAGRAMAGDDRCAIERAVGVSDAVATAVEDVVCATVHEHARPDTKHRIRITAIERRLVLTLVADRGGIVSEKQVILNGFDEVAVAAPRLVEALAQEKRIAETETVTNIVSSEARTPKKKKSEVHPSLGIVAVGALNGAATGGAQFSVAVGSPAISFAIDIRGAGDSIEGIAKVFTLGALDLSGQKMGYGSIASSVRHHFSEHDTAPFVGAGLALASISMTDADRSENSSGIAGVVEVGLDVLRTSSVGGTVSARFDAPTFELVGTQRLQDGSTVGTRSYAPIAGAVFALRF